MFIDFAALKEAVSFAQAVSLLDLQMKKSGNQYRSECPVCGGGDRGLVITEGRGWYCFSLKAGGDVIALTAHILDLPAKEAAQELAKRAGIVQEIRTSEKVRVPESEAGQGSKLSPLSYLEFEHEMLAAFGFDPNFCKAIGLGYAPRGVCRGSIAVPIRDEHGTLLGYLAAQDFTYIPPDFQTNVVPIKKRA